MKRVTKTQIDQLAHLKASYDQANKEAKKVEKLYKTALAPVLEYLDEVLKLPVSETAELRGKTTIVEFGKCRQTRVITDQVEALRRLEAVREGLGFASITIPLKVLDAELRAEELTDLVKTEHGARSVKATIFDDE